MIHSIEIRGFRIIHYANVTLSPFQVLVGPNASGKTTFFEAVNLVRDILHLGLEKAVMGDRRAGITGRAVDPLDLTWMRKGEPVEIAINAILPERVKHELNDKYAACRYELSLDLTGTPVLRQEAFLLLRHVPEIAPRREMLFPIAPVIPETVLLSNEASPKRKRILSKTIETNDNFYSETGEWNFAFRLGEGRSALANLPEDVDKFPAATWFKQLLMEGVFRLALNAEAMRLPSGPGEQRVYRPDGSNLPWVVHELETKHPDLYRDWCAHLQTALEDLDHVMTVERQEDRSRYLVLEYRNGLRVPSWVASDGTLRMLALTLLAYTPEGPDLVMIEEPENGIHPRAIATVFESLSNADDRQIFCATHSAIILSKADTRHLLCFSKTADGQVDIVSGAEHPQLKQVRRNLNLGDLFAAGILGPWVGIPWST